MSIAAQIDALANDRKHGASFLARKAVQILVESVEAGNDPVALARALAAARTGMGAGAIAGAVGRVVAAAHDPAHVAQEGHALLARYRRAPRSIAVLAGPYITGRVLTHSTSATVARVLQRVAVEPTSSLDDADVVLVGAETVFRDGSIMNAAGTCALADAAAAAGLPFVVAAETLKLVPTDGVEPDDELSDLTPAVLIDAVVTEEGVFSPDEIATLVDRTPFLREGYELVAHAYAS